MVVIVVSFVGVMFKHESMVKIQKVHGWLRDGFPLFVIPMGIFTMYNVKWENFRIKVPSTLLFWM